MGMKEAYESLPRDVVWSCSFGYPGQGGFQDWFRDTSGTIYIVKNGPYYDSSPFKWSVEIKRA